MDPRGNSTTATGVADINVPATLQRALAHHQAGRLTEAEQVYRSTSRSKSTSCSVV